VKGCSNPEHLRDLMVVGPVCARCADENEAKAELFDIMATELRNYKKKTGKTNESDILLIMTLEQIIDEKTDG
tara:strand:+ start:46184 stop:46402 length:219 start_codon:yes stop_codon:yes gene_type:complete